nr:uncharacterized protein LOC123765768 [Procambarus clarkii]
MKERKSESLFTFRRANNRYSLHLEKPPKKEADVQLKRASWSSFPLLRFASFDDKSSSSSSGGGGGQLSSKSHSIEDIKQQKHTQVNTPKIGCSFLRGSTASFRSAFSSPSSSSSSSSSPSIRSSGSSGKSSITSILEGSVCESQYDSCSTVEDAPPHLPARGGHLPSPPRDLPPLTNEFPSASSSLDDIDEVRTSPKILYVHRKTPDVQRKSRKQLVQELEFVKRNGALPEDKEIKSVKTDEEKENVLPKVQEKQAVKSRSSFRFMQGYRFMGKNDTKTPKMATTTATGSSSGEGYQSRTDASERLCDNGNLPTCFTTSSPSPQHTAAPLSFTLTDFINTGLGGFYLHNEDPGVEVYNKDIRVDVHSKSVSSVVHSKSVSPALHSKSVSPALHSKNVSHDVPNKGISTKRSIFDLYNKDFEVTDASLGQVDTDGPFGVRDACFQLNDAVNSGFINSRLGVFSPVFDYVEAKNSELIEANVERVNEGICQLASENGVANSTNFVLDETKSGTNVGNFGAQFINYSITNTNSGSNATNLDANLGVIEETLEEREKEEEDSECDLSEYLIHTDDSSSFEARLEDKLEALEDGVEADMSTMENQEIAHDAASAQGHLTPLVRTELKLNLAKAQNKMLNQVCRSRLLRHISEEAENVASGGEEEVELRSPSRTPSTPRSPAIDIDDVFQQKQREIEEGTDDMSRVRDLATRLKLATRRPSYLDWIGEIKQRGQEMGEVLEVHTPRVLEEGQKEEEVEEELSPQKRKDNLQSAMAWLRKELLEMRQQDQHLARQLMQLRIELQRVRLLRSCNNHQALVDEVTNEAEEAKTYEASDCELPADLRDTFCPVLREIGVTRMNITSRRFSLR